MKFRSMSLVLAAVLFSVGGTYAQRGRTVTPFTPRVTDSTGKKVYVQPQEVRKSRIAIRSVTGIRPSRRTTATPTSGSLS